MIAPPAAHLSAAPIAAIGLDMPDRQRQMAVLGPCPSRSAPCPIGDTAPNAVIDTGAVDPDLLFRLDAATIWETCS